MLHVFLLGEQTITDASGALRMRSARAVADRPQTRQRIAALFWPDSTEVQALTNLRRELHHLRSALPDEASLVVTARDLCWRDDAIALEHADAAIGHYRGELRPGSYDDWLLEARSDLETSCTLLRPTSGPAWRLADQRSSRSRARVRSRVARGR